MFNLPSFAFAFVAYQSTSMLSTETIGIGVAIMGAVLFQQLLNAIVERNDFVIVAEQAPVSTAKPKRKLRLQQHHERPVISWTGRDPLNPIDTDW